MAEIDNWEAAREDFRENVLPKLSLYGPSIGDDVRKNPQGPASKIAKYYSMLHRSFDPMTLELLKQAMKEYGL